MAMSMTACGGSADSGNTAANEQKQVTTEAASNVADNGSAAEETPAPATDEGDLGDYHVKILDAETGLTDYEGNPVIGVKYEYTNNSEDNMMFEIAVNANAFQDGVQLETAILDETSAEYDNSMKEIKTGTTLACEVYYELTSESDVEVEVTEFASFDDDTKLEKTFTLGQ